MMDIKEVLLLCFANSIIIALANKSANSKIKQKLQLAEELHKPIIRNFKKITVYFGFKDNIQGADLADMLLISKFNKGTRFLLCH